MSHNLGRKNQMIREISSHCDKNSTHNIRTNTDEYPYYAKISKKSQIQRYDHFDTHLWLIFMSSPIYWNLAKWDIFRDINISEEISIKTFTFCLGLFKELCLLNSRNIAFYFREKVTFQSNVINLKNVCKYLFTCILTN